MKSAKVAPVKNRDKSARNPTNSQNFRNEKYHSGLSSPSRPPSKVPANLRSGSMTSHQEPKRTGVGAVRSNESKFYGWQACQAIWRYRPNEVIRAYLTKERLKLCRPMLKSLADTKRAYHIVEAVELEKIAKTVHHQGICLLASLRASVDFETWRSTSLQLAHPLILYLDHIGNSHNLGAILRTAAHFDLSFLFGPKDVKFQLTPSACRTAAGGAEHVDLVTLGDVTKALTHLKEAGYAICATSSHKGRDMFSATWPDKAVVLLGSEERGLDPNLERIADCTLSIGGSGAIDSLNVSVAAALFMGESRRRQNQRGSKKQKSRQ